MRVAVYARVPAARQAQSQTVEQQLDRLRAAAAERGWELDEQHVYRDDGYSGASLGRPGLDRLRDYAALTDLDVVLVTTPDRLARNYVHQVLLIEELAGHGCRVEFVDRPMSADPHDQLLLQIRGAVAEYERALIAERMRCGRGSGLPYDHLDRAAFAPDLRAPVRQVQVLDVQAQHSADLAAVSCSIRQRVRSHMEMSSRVSSRSTSARDSARERSFRRRRSSRAASSRVQP
jgi:predicted site-specific integrase-resolvase